MAPLIGFIVLVIDLLYLGRDRPRDLELARRLQCSEHEQPGRVDDCRHALPTDGACAQGRSATSCPISGGIDISPVILILILLFFRDVVLLGWLAPAVVPSE